MPEPVLLGGDEAAERLRVSERTVRRYGKAGLVEERRIGLRLRPFRAPGWL
jgi:DNA-binding transcriptional MerR regulator